MEAPRRLAILSSHLRPITDSATSTSPDTPKQTTAFASKCYSRSHVVDVEEGNRGGKDCVFCKIIRGEAPALKLYEDDVCLCILDTNPVSHGHSLIIPKCHFSTLDTTPPSVIGAMCSKVPLISNAVMKSTGSDSFNLLVNNGAAAGQVVFHTHIHIIPRKAHDCLWAYESLQRHPLKSDKKASQLVDSIRDQLSFLEGYGDSKSQASSIIGNSNDG